MKTQVYLSNSFANSESDILKIRTKLINLGYEVIEHKGTWTSDSMKYYLSIPNKLFFIPKGSINVGRGQAQMIEAALDNDDEVYVIHSAEDSIIIRGIFSMNFIEEDYKINWAELDLSDTRHDITKIFPIIETDFSFEKFCESKEAAGGNFNKLKIKLLMHKFLYG